ncbi:Dolichyldiphosphatase/Peroxidase, partial [Scytalidium lignicola]
MADPTPLASLSLTHVHYDPNDPISYICAFLALVPQGLCVAYATLIWSTREVEILLMFCGQMACEAANFALKRILKEERPKQMHGKGYGMPSSHAQFVAFFSVSLSLFLLLRHVPREKTANYRPLYFVERLGLSMLALGCAGLVAWSRVYLSYHTPKQVLVGVVAGTVTAVCWFVIVAMVRRVGLLQFVLELPLTRFFRVRDLVVEEDLSQAGWEKWEARRLTSQSTVNGKKIR